MLRTSRDFTLVISVIGSLGLWTNATEVEAQRAAGASSGLSVTGTGAPTATEFAAVVDLGDDAGDGRADSSQDAGIPPEDLLIFSVHSSLPV